MKIELNSLQKRMRYVEDRRTKKACFRITVSFYKKLLASDRFYHVLDMINKYDK